MIHSLQNPLYQALAAGLITWLATTLGASLVFFFKMINQNILNVMLGFAAGIMVAASCYGLLLPAFTLENDAPLLALIYPTVGFFTGGLFLQLLDKVLPHLHPSLKTDTLAEGPKSTLKRNWLMVIAITIHNLPEGLALGVAFGAVGAASVLADSTLALGSAIALMVAIAIQDVPEGFAVSIFLRREGISRFKAFAWGSASALVEPIGAVIGALLVTLSYNMLPFMLAFAAGAMLFVVIEEVIPEMQGNQHSHLPTFGFLLGFIVMMLLDVLL